MTSDGTDTPAEHRPAQPGWGERLALWGMAGILSTILFLVLMFVLDPLVGRKPAHAVAKGLSMAVLFEVGYGVRSIRSFLVTAAVFLAAFSVYEWWWG